jgi:rhodanese-related sulfurtransferase
MADQARRILPHELKALMDREPVTILDLRRGSWEQSDVKLPEAIRVEPDEYRSYVGSLPQGRTVVTYCT